MKKKVLIAISVFIIAFIPFSIMAQSSDEHCYKAIDFKNGVVGIKCSHCDDYYRIPFQGNLNQNEDYEWFNSALDVVEDGVINAKDYAKLKSELPFPTTTSKVTTTKRTTTTTSPNQTTDKDGYNNEILNP